MPETKSAVDPETLKIQAAFCKAMGHPTRLQILHMLHDAGGALPSAEILAATGVSKASLSQHLSKMAGVGLIKTHREGRFLQVDLACLEVGQACNFVHAALRNRINDQASAFEG